MTVGHELDGLMKFLSRDEWRDCFSEIFGDHLGPVLDAFDIDFEDIADMLGEAWPDILWGCAFEDFLTQDFDVPGGNIVDEYLKRRGWKESAQSKAYMKALRNSRISLYEMSDIVPGKSVLARDLIRGGEPILVYEHSATKSIKQWDRIAARIVPVMGRHIFAGSLLPFTQKASDDLFDGFRLVFGKRKTKKLPIFDDDELHEAARIFTHSWLFDALENIAVIPSIQNSDGHDFMFHDVRFPIASGVTQKDIAAKINTIAGMSQDGEKSWNWLEVKPKAKNKSKPKAGSFDTDLEDGYRILGSIEIKGRFMHLMTNSAERSAVGMGLVKQALGDLVRVPLTEIRTVNQVMADKTEDDTTDVEAAMPADIAHEIVHQVLDRKYRETLDQPVPMLGNITPRQAAKTAAGRKKLVEWLKYLENQIAVRHQHTDPMATYSFEWIWRELNILDLRK
ncbi:hypothetical protein OPR82_18510 [Brucella sp. YY2X]|uniref:DUF2384 domain-containing protein n=2 Tax=Ochrobactrum chromiisoli TaxID=2993941 RepID=A0ABT3QSY3_9HYPH|nr:hypothetical protein [Ochrobactrum chromiisoli]